MLNNNMWQKIHDCHIGSGKKVWWDFTAVLEVCKAVP